MSGTIAIDKAGRVVIPKRMRDALHLKPGDELEIESSADGFHLRPRRSRARMFRKNGVWVIDTGGGPITTEMVNETLERGRREREQRARGE